MINDGADELMVGVFAQRTFRVSADGFLPPVSSVGDEWVDGTCIASCGRASNRAPADRCTYGLYSLTDLHELRTQYRQADRLLAVLALEGSCIEGAMGWRSQAARVVALWVAPTGRGRLPDRQNAALRQNYRRVAFFADRDEMLACWPMLIPQPGPRRAAIAEASRRTVTAIRQGRMGRGSVLCWAAGAAAVCAVMILAGRPGTSMTGAAVIVTFYLSMLAVGAVVANSLLVFGALVYRGGRVPPAWLAYRPGRYTWWICSAVLAASIPATLMLHGQLHLALVAMWVVWLLLLRLAEVFILSIPRQIRTWPGLLTRMGVGKRPPNRRLDITGRRTGFDAVGRIPRRLRYGFLLVPVHVIPPTPPTEQSS